MVATGRVRLAVDPAAEGECLERRRGQRGRAVVGGARLLNGAWRPWQPPCDPVNDGSATLAAATANDLVALCNNSFLGPPGIRIYTSRDGGSTFLRSTPSLSPSGYYTTVATPRAGTLVTNGSNVDGSLRLLESFDAGARWAAVLDDGPGSMPIDMGFTSPMQGVAVLTNGHTSSFVMTFDGGRHWSPAGFTSAT